MVAVQLGRLPTQLKIVLAATAVVAVAAFLPWISALGVTVSGISGDGVITLVLALGGGALILANRTGPRTSVIVEALLGAAVLIVAIYHANDPFAAIGIYLTLIGALVWLGALTWWWFEVRQAAPEVSTSRPGDQDLGRPLETTPPAEHVPKSEGSDAGSRPGQ